MKVMFFPKLAVNGISKNKKVYIPYILTCIGMVMITYIISFLSTSKEIATLRGGSSMQIVLSLGTGVVTVFSVIFLIYTNSFLIRHRNHEFGLYNILGMNKRNIARIILFENLIISALSIVLGLGFGILFSKLAQMLMVKMLGEESSFGFTVEISAVITTLIISLSIFLLILLNSLWKIFRTKPIELLHSENHGEKPPKANWFLAILGAIILGAGYYIALTAKGPSIAIVSFFIAVILVIIGSYMLFIAGSVVFCKILQNKKNYYYKSNHFVSVSSMAYRMKRNGAGLASICILSTIVLVMMSSVIYLFIGKEDSLRNQYPRDVIVQTFETTPDKQEEIDKIVNETVEKHDCNKINSVNNYQFVISTYSDTDTIYFDESKRKSNEEFTEDYKTFTIIPLDDYNRLTNSNETLKDNEMLVCKSSNYNFSQITFEGVETKSLRKCKDIDLIVSRGSLSKLTGNIIMVAPDIESMQEICDSQHNLCDGLLMASNVHYIYAFDLDCNDDTEQAIANEIYNKLSNLGISDFNSIAISEMRDEFYSMYGGLLFLGILLGIVFVFAAILIMYYKQITEGYEDQDKFEILQKVGMTQNEIKSSINSQILTVFFVPLIAAGIHTTMAFKIIYIMIAVFGLTNLPLLMATTFGCFLLFAIFYITVYLLTSKSYFKIIMAKDK